MENFSIITVCLNAADTIRNCIESVLMQKQPVEYIIIDGGSIDGTLDVLQEYRKWLSKVISETDDGIYDAMNKGIALASGEIIGMLNADDFYNSPNVLTKVSKTFSSNDVHCCYGDLVYVYKNDTDRKFRYWRSGNFSYRRFFLGWMPPHPTLFVKKCVYEQYGYFNLNLGSAADYELMLRFLVKHRLSAAYIPETLVRMRAGGISNLTIKNRLLANRNDRLAWKINHLKPYPWTLCLKPILKIKQYLFL
jgi:glycosyltransferase